MRLPLPTMFVLALSSFQNFLIIRCIVRDKLQYLKWNKKRGRAETQVFID